VCVCVQACVRVRCVREKERECIWCSKLRPPMGGDHFRVRTIRKHTVRVPQARADTRTCTEAHQRTHTSSGSSCDSSEVSSEVAAQSTLRHTIQNDWCLNLFAARCSFRACVVYAYLCVCVCARAHVREREMYAHSVMQRRALRRKTYSGAL
jgi:hypothetical protein